MITIKGYSDDIVIIESLSSASRSVDCFDQRVHVTVGDSEAGGVVVVLEYGANDTGVWTAMVARIDEEVPIPWGVSITEGDTDYSIAVQVMCPPDTEMSVVRLPSSFTD